MKTSLRLFLVLPALTNPDARHLLIRSHEPVPYWPSSPCRASSFASTAPGMQAGTNQGILDSAPDATFVFRRKAAPGVRVR